MRDKEVNLEEIEVSHKLGGVGWVRVRRVVTGRTGVWSQIH